MKVLVIGSLPPPATERSRGLLAEVLRLRSQGEQVEVLSPEATSVAHRYLNLSGPGAAIEVAAAARRADAVVVQLQPGFPFEATASRADRALSLLALAAALRNVKAEVTVRLHSLDDLPGGGGGRAADALFAAAQRIEVGDEETRERLSEVVTDERAARISLSIPPFPQNFTRRTEGDLAGEASLEAVSALVRSRAARERDALLGEEATGITPSEQPQVPLWQWAPRPGVAIPHVVQTSFVSREAAPMMRRLRSVVYEVESNRVVGPLARRAHDMVRAKRD